MISPGSACVPSPPVLQYCPPNSVTEEHTTGNNNRK